MIEIKSFNQILGSMVRKIVAETPLSDINPGSVFLSLLEACASNDFENNVAILNVLELLSVDSIRNNDLDNKAADFGIVRRTAVAASGTVTISNSNISKQSTTLYSLKPAPIAGQTVLFVTNTRGWSPSGSLYIGRGTPTFEGPIPYTSITTFATYSQITLGAALQKDHLGSDMVVNAQGQPDRLIPAGTIVKIPANNQTSDILYSSLRDAILPAGEDRVENILVVAQVPGTQGNALINTIRQFSTVPFPGAIVNNTQAFTTGQDTERNEELRNRIKSYAASLARGTSPAILSAVIGVSDPDENKRVVSAVLSNPVEVGAPSILYIDDGSGFQPSTAGQAVDVLLAKANGTEEFLQLSNYPLPRPQVVNNAVGPFLMADQMFLRVAVDNTEDTVVFQKADFVNIAVATASEIVSAINKKSTLFKARLANDSTNILLYPVDPDAETIQIVPLRPTDDSYRFANNTLNFPTDEVSYIALYKNSTRLKQRAKVATVETVPFAAWNLLGPGNLILSVDGTPSQDGALSLSDFQGMTSFTLLTLEHWVRAINTKFAGITAVATPSQTMKISSNKNGNSASVQVLGGTYLAPMFSTNSTVSTGQESDFEINRQSGHIRIHSDIAAGDTISAGVTDAKGYVVSASTTSGAFDLSEDNVGRDAQLVMVVDAKKCDRINLNLQVGDIFEVSQSGSNSMTIMSHTVAAFQSVQPGHYIYIAPRLVGGFNPGNTGLFRVFARGGCTSAGVDTYIQVHSNNTVDETVSIIDVADVAVFSTDAYPQIWRASVLPDQTSATLAQIVASLNSEIRGIKASIFRTTSVKLTSTTEKNGSIAIPVAIGKASLVFPVTAKTQENNPPLIAEKISQKDMVGFPKFAPITSNNAFLSRTTYPLVNARISENVDPEFPPPYISNFSERFEHDDDFIGKKVDHSDLIYFIKGDNKGHIRSISTLPTMNQVGTQRDLPYTAFGHASGDEVIAVQSLKLAADENIVCVVDNDATIKTIDVSATRNGQVNSGSGSESFIPTTTEFSANDSDNEVGIDFSTPSVWDFDINGTDFRDYAVLMRARNWYSSGGTGGSGGKFIVRAAEYGLNGEKLRFGITYPLVPNQEKTLSLSETPSYTLLNYVFGSGTDRPIALPSETTMTVLGPYPDVATNFPAGTASSGKYWDVTFSGGNFASVQVGDVLSMLPESGIGNPEPIVFSIQAKSGNTLRAYLPEVDGTNTFTITTPTAIHIFGLSGTTVGDIVSVVNDSGVLVAAAIGSAGATITKATSEEVYPYVSNATALAYDHNPDQVAKCSNIPLVDGINWIKYFGNQNPNFTLKKPLVITSSGVTPSIYVMHTTPNEDETTGERFKLVPTTIRNVQHHLTQKAISQLPILSEVNVAGRGRRVQIVSKRLGSAGGVQVVGGGANMGQTDLIGDSLVTADHLLARVSAFPSAYSVGDIVKMQNRTGVRRKSRLGALDSVSVEADGSGFVKYLWDSKTTNFTENTRITITDVSSLYRDYSGTPLDSGMIFRWTHGAAAAENLANIKPGDVVAAYDCPGWDQGNLAKIAGEGAVAGLPIIAVNDAAHYFDVVCPSGKPMAATPISRGVLSIYPSPQIRWNLAHVAPVSVDFLTRNFGLVTVTCSKEHMLNTGDSVTIQNSSAFADGVFGPITVTSPSVFTFFHAGSTIAEGAVGATVTSVLKQHTKYRLESLGLNNLVRLICVGGTSPRFADAGVAVDDYLVISGATFNSLNNGTFRVIAVDNNSVIFENPNAVSDLNTIVEFNNIGLSTQWTSNSSLITGAAGTFKNVDRGMWVKKQGDEDRFYLQVIGCNTGVYATATQVFLGAVYTGITGTATGVAYHQTIGFEGGVLLKNDNDIAFYEGDSALPDDALSVQRIVNDGWFSAENSGNFVIVATGTNPSDYRPFVRIKNASGRTESARDIAASLEGFYITESNANKFSSYRRVDNSQVSADNKERRSMYLLPNSRSYKFSEANGTFITHTGKLGYDLNATVGKDGYLFYTGLLRRVQRTVDGFSPDPVNFPERRAIGSRIETLPPLIKNLSMFLTVTANQGATVQDVTSNVKSAIIDYVQSLGVGQDVILSSIIAKVMQVRGIAAVTFNVPAAAQERIQVASNEKAVITADNIGIN